MREWVEGTGEGGRAVDEAGNNENAVGIDEDLLGTDDSTRGATFDGTGGGEHGGSGHGARQMDEIVDFASSGMLCDLGGSRRRMSAESDCWRSCRSARPLLESKCLVWTASEDLRSGRLARSARSLRTESIGGDMR